MKKGKINKTKLNKLASQIAKLEGKKSQVHIGNIREILKIIIVDEEDMLVDLIIQLAEEFYDPKIKE